MTVNSHDIRRDRIDLRRAIAIDALEGLSQLCLNQMRGSEPPMSKIGYVLQILTAEAREAMRAGMSIEEPDND